jgi:HlyD family secretion protein
MRILLIIAAASATALGAYYGYARLDGTSQSSLYRTDQIQRGSIIATASATGTVEPLVKVLVGSQVSGTVVRWYTDFNATVNTGDVLAELDQDRILATIDENKAQLARARARAEEAAARVAATILDLQRLEYAHSQHSASDFEMATARTTHQAAVAAHHAAEADVQVAEATLRAAEIQLDKTIIRSPIDGVVISRDIDAGQTVAASLSAPTLFTIANDLTHMRVSAAVSESDIGHIREGMAAQFRVDAYPNKRFDGVVTQVRFAETVVDNVVTYETLIDVDNPELLLRPGMTATILFEVARADDAVLIPNAALRFDPRREPEQVRERGRGSPMRPRVFKIPPDPNAAILEVTVEPGISDGKSTQLLGGDLQEGDTVVVGFELSQQRPRPGGLRLF